MGYSIRTSRYRYTEWRDFRTLDVVATELYDHRSDPRETNNVINDAKAGLRRQLARQLNSVISRQALPEQN